MTRLRRLYWRWFVHRHEWQREQRQSGWVQVSTMRAIAREVRDAWALLRWLRATAAFGVLVECPRCEGTGALPPLPRRFAPWEPGSETCPDCNGAMFAVRRRAGGP